MISRSNTNLLHCNRVEFSINITNSTVTTRTRTPQRIRLGVVKEESRTTDTGSPTTVPSRRHGAWWRCYITRAAARSLGWPLWSTNPGHQLSQRGSDWALERASERERETAPLSGDRMQTEPATASRVSIIARADLHTNVNVMLNA